MLVVPPRMSPQELIIVRRRSWPRCVWLWPLGLPIQELLKRVEQERRSQLHLVGCPALPKPRGLVIGEC